MLRRLINPSIRIMRIHTLPPPPSQKIEELTKELDKYKLAAKIKQDTKAEKILRDKIIAEYRHQSLGELIGLGLFGTLVGVTFGPAAGIFYVVASIK
jgi:hypothetical protein